MERPKGEGLSDIWEPKRRPGLPRKDADFSRARWAVPVQRGCRTAADGRTRVRNCPGRQPDLNQGKSLLDYKGVTRTQQDNSVMSGPGDYSDGSI